MTMPYACAKCEALAAEGWVFGTGFGEDPQGRWPGEASVLIWGMDALTARIWGEQWQQTPYSGAAPMPYPSCSG